MLIRDIMHRHLYVFVFCTTFVCLVKVQAQNGTSCETPTKQSGLCVSVYTCKFVTDILSSRSVTPERRNFIKSLSCGFKDGAPLVCCPQSSTRGSPNTVVEVDDQLGSTEINNSAGTFLTPPQCGVSKVVFPKVVGGVPAKLGEFPWIVALGYKNSKNPTQPKWLCAGTLITSKHVLTAAHCVYNRNDLYLARVGELDLFDDNEGAHPVDIELASAKIHENYNPSRFSGDIAILTLSRTIEGIPGVSPICLPWEPDRKNKSYLNTNPFVAGWGALYFNGPTSSSLQLASIPVVDNNLCATAYAKRSEIDNRIICAGYPNGEIDACKGDSGGPLMTATIPKGLREIRFYLIGIVSYGSRCAEAGYPGVYTRVTHFLDWIQSNVV